MKKKIIYVSHLLNDYSGSPRVLSGMLTIYSAIGYEINMYTSSGQGHLSNIADVNMNTYTYTWSKYKIQTLYSYLKIQINTFFLLKKKITSDDILIVNTLLPFGAALAARYRKADVIYYFHESYIKPVVLFRFLCFVAKKCATRSIYVSRYLKQVLPSFNIHSYIIHNTLPLSFTEKISEVVCYSNKFVVFMATSMKEYKGYKVLFLLAERLKFITFNIVFNASDEEVSLLVKQYKYLRNLNIYGKQESLNLFYKSAHLVINLTDPRVCVESFGMTVLEGMAYGLPAIVPPVGGVVELIDNDQNGYLIDSNNLEELSSKLTEVAKNEITWKRLSQNALKKYNEFDQNKMKEQYVNLIKTFDCEK